MLERVKSKKLKIGLGKYISADFKDIILHILP